MLNFPSSPTNGQVYSSAGKSWTYDGTKWKISGLAVPIMIVTNGTTTLATGFTGVVRVENNTNLPITISLPPTPTASQEITIKDMQGNAGLYAITVAGNGKLIEGVISQVIMFNYGWISLIYNGTIWGQI